MHLQQKFHKKSVHGAPIDPIAENVLFRRSFIISTELPHGNTHVVLYGKYQSDAL